MKVKVDYWTFFNLYCAMVDAKNSYYWDDKFKERHPHLDKAIRRGHKALIRRVKENGRK